MLTVLMGTVYPLLVDGLGLGKLSVGAPYFNAVFVPLMIPLLMIMGLGIHLRWHQDPVRRTVKKLLPVMITSVFLPFVLLLWFAPEVNAYCLLGLSLAFWIILSYLVFSRFTSETEAFFCIESGFHRYDCSPSGSGGNGNWYCGFHKLWYSG